MLEVVIALFILSLVATSNAQLNNALAQSMKKIETLHMKMLRELNEPLLVQSPETCMRNAAHVLLCSDISGQSPHRFEVYLIEGHA